ncbi:hypothetical protein BU14_0147s0034 [Porphyra umbilicalis]|uniref:Uncharacterized protein n=1 Tax=Porphyra umbilicalis TaxID=2786 RepID=A0A1X6P9H2_PORUM|nr:hypothetical protein BU14_0147s0034 [Porphyra umbilicalis]|eukprot:OSX77508.1 hypothetical protein BU14_0147s0034 [Porphyra umbilicalis]
MPASTRGPSRAPASASHSPAARRSAHRTGREARSAAGAPRRRPASAAGAGLDKTPYAVISASAAASSADKGGRCPPAAARRRPSYKSRSDTRHLSRSSPFCLREYPSSTVATPASRPPARMWKRADTSCSRTARGPARPCSTASWRKPRRRSRRKWYTSRKGCSAGGVSATPIKCASVRARTGGGRTADGAGASAAAADRAYFLTVRRGSAA